MKKILLLFTFIITGFICKAQISAINDTVQIIPNQSISPVQFRSSAFNSGGINYRIPYLINPSTGKLDFTPTGKYIRAFYLPINSPTFTGYLTGPNISIPSVDGSDTAGIEYMPSVLSGYYKTFYSKTGVNSSAIALLGDRRHGDYFKFQQDTNQTHGMGKKIADVFKFNLDTANLYSSKFFAKNIYQNGNQVANDNAVVHLTGDETINNIKSFTSDIKIQGLTVGKGAHTGSANNGNIAFGDSSLAKTTSGTYNIGIGYRPLKENTTGIGNIAIGGIALSNETTGSRNIAIGYQAGNLTTTGFNNTFLGASAGRYNTTGSGNTYIGTNAGSEFATQPNGSNNVFIGANAGSTESGSLKFYLGSATPAPDAHTYTLLKGDFLTGQLNLPTAAVASTGGYKVLTRNNSTGDIQSVIIPDSTSISGTYVKKSGDVMTDSLDVDRQLRTYNPGSYVLTNTTGSVFTGFQNMYYDGTYYWILGTSTLTKYDNSFTQIAQNANIFSGVTGGLNHGSGIAFSGTHIVITASGTGSPGVIILKKSDLSLLAQYTLPPGVSSTGTVIIRDSLYTGSYSSAGTKIWKTDTATYSHGDTLTLSNPITGLQGLGYDGTNLIYFAQSGIYTSTTTGKNVRLKYFYNATSEVEGGSYYGGNLYWLIRNGALSTSYIITLTPSSNDFYPFVAGQTGDVSAAKNLYANGQLNLGVDLNAYPAFSRGPGLRNKFMIQDPQSTNIINHTVTTNTGFIYDNVIYDSFNNVNNLIDSTKYGVGMFLSRQSGFGGFRVAQPGASLADFKEFRYNGSALYPVTAGQDLGIGAAATTWNNIYTNGVQFNNKYGTNSYEWVRQYFTGNVFNITSGSGSTGTTRSIRIQVQNADSSSYSYYKLNYSGTPKHEFYTTATATNAMMYQFHGLLGQSSTVAFGMMNIPTVNQTGSAGFIINGSYPYLQGVGSSGTKILLGAGTYSAADGTGTRTDYFTVGSTGTITASTLNTAGIVTNTSAGVLGTVGTTGTGNVVLAGSPTFTTQIKTPTSVLTGITSGTAETDSILVKKSSDNKIYKIPNIYVTQSSTANYINRLSPLDSLSGDAKGAQVVGHNLLMQSASATVPGLVNTTNQTFGGNKTANVFIGDAAVQTNGFMNWFDGANGLNLVAPSRSTTYSVTLPSAAGTLARTSELAIGNSYSTTAAAQTSFTVTIGATQANTTYKVNVTPTSLVSAAVFYVTNKTTTTFDVVYLTGLTGAVSFDWSLFK